MRQLLLDELSAEDVSAIRDFLNANAIESGVTDLFWIELSQDLLNPDQYEASDDHPFCFAAEIFNLLRITPGSFISFCILLSVHFAIFPGSKLS